ncbi:armadillo-type protein [Cladochytrium replicatum]|nr:armadillo-type protein [Cladochytrium replicatum]
MSLLRPLLLDSVPAIQQAAALALGRLANYNAELAHGVVETDILPQLVYSLSEQSKFYKKAAAFVLRAVAKHSPDLAQSVVNSGALAALVGCLEELDPGVKEAAAWALGYVALHNRDLSQSVVDVGAVPLLVVCVQEPELPLRRISALALSDIAKHSPELAQAVVDAGSISIIPPLLSNSDAKLRRQAVVDGEIFPNAMSCLKDSDSYVRRNAATLVCEITKHTPELAQLIVNSGGIAVVVDYINESHGNARLPGIMTLGYIAAFSETLALAVIFAKGVHPRANALVNEAEDHIKALSDHAKTISNYGVLPKLLKTLVTSTAQQSTAVTGSGADLRTKTKRPLFQQSTPHNILKYVIGQFAKILPHDVAARRFFVTSGCLQRVQEISASYGAGPQGQLFGADPIVQSNQLLGTKLGEYIRIINQCYPEEIVRYYSPGYSATLLEKVNSFGTNVRSSAVALTNAVSSNGLLQEAGSVGSQTQLVGQSQTQLQQNPPSTEKQASLAMIPA